MRIAIAQINTTVGAFKENERKILSCVGRACEASADIIVFPELAITGYPPEDLLLKDHFIKHNLKTLKNIVKKVDKITAVIGFVDQDEQKNLYNAAAVVKHKKIRDVYRKEELPNYGVFDEKRYFLRGRNRIKIFRQKKTSVAVNICEDIWVDESVAQRQVQKGAKVLINISSSPYDIKKIAQRRKLLKKRAKELDVYICYANLVGGQDELVFDGNSLIVDPRGEIIAAGAHCQEDFFVCDLFAPSQRLPRKFPSSKAERVYQALVLGTRDYIHKSGFEKVVIGLSGGIDSSLVAAIAADALGLENVIGVSMPSRYSSKGTRSDAEKLAQNLGIAFKEIPIEDIVCAYTKTLSGEFAGTKSDVTQENIQARIRGNILMALSNKFHWMVLTTGNKSEMAVGYCTLYGDMSGGFAVIKDVPKTMVYSLARFRNKTEEVIPSSILLRAPSAELRPGQKDQDSLPLYGIMDPLLEQYIEKHYSFGKMSRKGGNSLAKKIISLVDHSEYKRRQSPPGVKITPRAFGRDWRLPITNKYREF